LYLSFPVVEPQDENIKTEMLPAYLVPYGYGTLSLTSRMRVVESRVLKRILRQKRDDINC
jgi:hypothetical protein